MNADKFVVDQKHLVSILTAMQPICAKRTTVDATSNILFQVGHKELILKSTDLEVSLQYSCGIIDTEITEQRSFLVGGKKIFELVKELEGEVQFQINANNIIINNGGAHLSLNIKEAQEFPPFPERIENLMHWKAEDILSMFDKVAFLVPQNNSNPALNGLLVEVSNQNVKMTATDGHCLAQAVSNDYKLDKDYTWLLPRRAIFELKKIVDNIEDEQVFIGTCDNQLVFSGGSFNFFTKLLVDNFPQYQAIMAKEGFFKAAIKKDHFVRTLRRSSCLLSGQFIATQFGFDKNNLNVIMQNKEIGSLEEELILEEFDSNSKLDVRFYAPYILNGLQAFSGEKIDFYLNSNAKPIIFESDKDNVKFTYLAMPVSPTSNEA